MSKQEDFHRPEKPYEKTQEIDNDARISKETEILVEILSAYLHETSS